jgi:hypothetical protein
MKMVGKRRLAATAISAASLLASFGLAGSSARAASGSAPVNGPIVYLSGMSGSLSDVVVNQDGSGAHSLYSGDPCGFGNPGMDGVSPLLYSPDGTKVAFGCTSNTMQIGTADLKYVSRLNTGPNDHPVAWSPDGRSLYYTETPLQGGATTLMRMNIDGTGATKVRAIPTGLSVVSAAPNGALLVFDLRQATAGVYVLDPGADTPRPIRLGFPSSGAGFSPDGTKIALVQQTSGGTGDIFVYNADGTGGTQVTHVTPLQGYVRGLVWSPDGQQLAYSVSAATPQKPNDFLNGQVWTVPAQAGATATMIASVPNGVADVTAWHNGAIPATPTATATRLAGATRISTSVAVADAAYGAGKTKASVAVLSRDDNFADALPGNALAAEKHGPLLLTGSGALDPATRTELSKVLAPGSVVYLLGGPQALSPEVEAQIKAMNLVPRRLAGPDRFSTAVAIAAEVSPHPHTVLVATGRNYPDALAAGAAAATDPDGGVVLLSDDSALPTATRSYLTGVDPSKTHVYGVGVQGVNALNTLSGFPGHFTPLEGGDRYATDLAVAGDATLFPAIASAGVATALNWPDALSGGAFIGAQHGPLLLIDSSDKTFGNGNNQAVSQWVAAHRAPVTGLLSLTAFGGTAVVPDVALTTLAQVAWPHGPVVSQH